MTTTTHPEPVQGYLLNDLELDWSTEDWQEHFWDDAFTCSVLHAADDDLALSVGDMQRLLRLHGIRLADYLQDLQDAAAAGARTLPLDHAGQALRWLGY